MKDFFTLEEKQGKYRIHLKVAGLDFKSVALHDSVTVSTLLTYLKELENDTLATKEKEQEA
jgi:hypothetical protein